MADRVLNIPKISFCVITKDNSGTIDDCLSSVKDLADELIVVDTGSTDNTKSKALSVSDKVVIYDHAWSWNFSEAKNFALTKANNPWILFLDADETVSSSDLDKIRMAIQTADSNINIMGISMIQRNYTNDIGMFGWVSCKGDSYDECSSANGFVPRRMIRIFRNNDKVLFEGVVHDSVEPSINSAGGTVLETNIPIHHYGIMNRDNNSRTKTYIDMELMNLRDNDFFQHYQLASQLHSVGELDEALIFIDKSISLNPEFYLSYLEKALILLKMDSYDDALVLLKSAEELLLKERTSDVTKGHLSMVFGSMAIVYSSNSDNFNPDKALSYYKKALFLNPNNADFYYNLGLLLTSINRKTEAFVVFKEAVRLNPSYEKLVQFKH